MLDEIKKTVLNTLAEPIANSAINITDKPTQNIGTTFADIWYLVFGGISQTAEKRKLKYSYALKEFEEELKNKISKIPKEKLVEPDIQIIAKALEEAKYCIDKEELRHMFSCLIASSMSHDFSVSPIIINIVSCLSPINAKMLKFYYQYENMMLEKLDEINQIRHNSTNNTDTETYIKNQLAELEKTNIDLDELKKYLNTSDSNIFNSIIELEHLNLLCSNAEEIENSKTTYQNVYGKFISFENTRLSLLGTTVCHICLN